MESKEDMELYHEMLEGKVVIKETTEETIEINEKYIAFLQHKINVTKELIESIKTFVEKLKYIFFYHTTVDIIN